MRPFWAFCIIQLMPSQSTLLFYLVCVLCTSCYRNYFYVQEEIVDRMSLASSHVGTPDPKQDCPPEGERLLISWNFPPSLFEKKPTLVVKVWFWDDSEETIIRLMHAKKDTLVLFFPRKSILTYSVQARSEDGLRIGEWEHPFWTERVIPAKDERCASIESRHSSVSSQPKQGSVTDTP